MPILFVAFFSYTNAHAQYTQLNSPLFILYWIDIHTTFRVMRFTELRLHQVHNAPTFVHFNTENIRMSDLIKVCAKLHKWNLYTHRMSKFFLDIFTNFSYKNAQMFVYYTHIVWFCLWVESVFWPIVLKRI